MTERTYGCVQAQEDIEAFFKRQDRTNLKASTHLLERAFGHMRDEKDPAKPVTRCDACWNLYRRLARKHDAD